MKSIDGLLELLKNVEPQKDGSWKACCPAHNDGQHKNEQSLSISLEGERILLHCFACCETPRIVQTLGLTMSDLFLDKPEKPEKKARSGRSAGEIEKVYQYFDLSGKNLLFEVVRYRPKAFKQRHPDGNGGHIYNLNGVEKIIYRAPQITAAIARGDTIFHFEGEKDVDNAVLLGLEGTTSPMGANNWKASYATYYTGAEQLIIIQDKDDPGRNYAQRVALDCHPKVKSIKLLELPGEKVKDFSDWLAAGGTREQLEKIIENTPPWQPQKLDLQSINYDSINSVLRALSDDQYCIINGGFHRITRTREGDLIETPISNFVARVIEDVLKDNGEDTIRYFKIQGRLNGSYFPSVITPEANFDSMKWIRKEWGVKARVVAGKSSNDHMINCIICSNDKVPERTLYTHTGWRNINGKWVYLTAGGAIGMPNIEVDLPPRLSRFRLPQPEGDPKSAIEKTLDLLAIADMKVSLPTFILPYLAVLNIFEEISFTPWYVGRSGSLKSVMMSLAASFFGNFTHKTLPLNWFGTRTELEKLSFMAKDILFPIDDYAPPTDPNAARKINDTVESIIREAGNRGQGRVRSNSDMSSQAVYYPRGMVYTSGENLPPAGVSRSARILPIPIRKQDFYSDDEFNFPLLTMAQQNRLEYPLAMAHYIKWIQDDWDNAKKTFQQKYEDYRTAAPKQGVHLRMIETVALMQTGLFMATEYARIKGALSSSTQAEYIREGARILANLVKTQNDRLTSERPGMRFIEVIQALLSTGKAILREKFTDMTQIKWRPEQQPPGQVILGWDDDPIVHIHSKIAFQEVWRFCNATGEYFGNSKEQTWQDLFDLGYLVDDDKEDPAAPKYIPGAGTQRVLEIRRSVLYPEKN